MRSDQSLWFRWDWTGLSRYTGVDALKDVTARMQVVDDGSKEGGVALGWTGTHGDFHHEFTATVGDRESRFEEFVSYAQNDKTTHSMVV